MSSSIVITGTPPHNRGAPSCTRVGRRGRCTRHALSVASAIRLPKSIASRFGPRCHCCPCSRRCRPATECLPPMLLAGSGRGGGKLTKSKLNIICCRNHLLEVCNSHRAVGGPTRWSQSDAMAPYCHPGFLDWPRCCYQQASRVCSGRSRLQSPPAHSILLSGPRPLWRSVELWRHAPLWVLPFA